MEQPNIVYTFKPFGKLYTGEYSGKWSVDGSNNINLEYNQLDETYIFAKNDGYNEIEINGQLYRRLGFKSIEKIQGTTITAELSDEANNYSQTVEINAGGNPLSPENPTPTRVGYIFLGWNTNPQDRSAGQWLSDNTLWESGKYYAVWTECTIHSYQESYACIPRVCTKCGFTQSATTAHTYAYDYTCHDRMCVDCNGGLITATTNHNYGTYVSTATAHIRTCLDCEFVDNGNHTYADNYTCHNRTCIDCEYICEATTAHIYADEYTCHDRTCLDCTYICEATKAHIYADEYTCHDRMCSYCGEGLIVATTNHTYADDYTCHDRMCLACTYACEATTNHTYADEYTCHDRMCSYCGEGLLVATTNHNYGTYTSTPTAHTQTCVDCAYANSSSHTYIDTYTCHNRTCIDCDFFCEATKAHSLNSDCLCTTCGLTAHAADGTYCRHGGTIYFGTYPQTTITDNSITTSLNTSAGSLPTSSNNQNWNSYGYYAGGNLSSYMWYIDIEYRGNSYRGVYFSKYRPKSTSYSNSINQSYQDDNGYYTGTTYWFRYDPIKWDIVEESGGYATLVADLILDSQDYYYQGLSDTRDKTDYQGNTAKVYDNNYQYSAVRTWLNEDFYNTAFTSLQQNLIQVVTVDNSASTTESSSNQYACNNTNDKVWLLSYKEAFDTYFNSNSTRIHKGTDYAKAQGLYVNPSGSSVDNSYLWLRSPYHFYCNYAYGVNYSGDYYSNYVLNTYYGILPALKISLN